MLNLIAVLSLNELIQACEAFRAEAEAKKENYFAKHDDVDEKDRVVQSEEVRGIKLRQFVALLLPFVVDALIRSGFEVPVDDDEVSASSSSVLSSPLKSPYSSKYKRDEVLSGDDEDANNKKNNNTSSSPPSFLAAMLNGTTTTSSLSPRAQIQKQKIAKVANRELRELFRTIDVKQKGSVDWDDLLRYFVDEIDRRSSSSSNQGGLSGERISQLSTSVGETLSFEQASAGSHSIFSVAHVTQSLDRRNQDICFFVPEFSAYVIGLSEAGRQGFEIVDAGTLRTVRIGYYSDKLSTILQAVAIPKYSLIVACHHDSTVTFWSLPAGSGSGGVGYSPARDGIANHNSGNNDYHHYFSPPTNRRSNRNDSSNNNTNNSNSKSAVVCFKRIQPNETPEHVRFFEWNSENSTLFSGSANGIIRKWILTSSSAQVERHAPSLTEFVQAHTTNVTQIRSVDATRIVTTSMDRSICVIDTNTMMILDRRGGRSINGYKSSSHGAGILTACVVEHDRNEIVVATAGFDEDVMLWNMYPSGLSNLAKSTTNPVATSSMMMSFSNSINYTLQMTKPNKMQDPSNPHRGPIHFISRLTNSTTNMNSHLIVTGDGVGIVKIWDTKILRCIQTIQACRLGDDDPPPPIVISTSMISAIVMARKTQQEIVDAEHMSAQTRRVFKGVSSPSSQQRRFVYTVDPKTSALFACGPKSQYLLRGHNPRNPERADDFSCLSCVQLPEIGCVLTLHNDCTKVWQLGTGALTSVHTSMYRTNLTCLAVDRHSRCYFVGDSRGFVSCHSTYSGSLACKWKVFLDGDGVLALRSMRRKDGTHLLFAISDCGSVSVTHTPEDFYDRQLQKESALSDEKKNTNNRQKQHSTSSAGEKDSSSSSVPKDRKIHHLNAVISRNIAVLQRHITMTRQDRPEVIVVSQDGRVDQNISTSSKTSLVRTASTLMTQNNNNKNNNSHHRPLKKKLSFISQAKLRHQQQKSVSNDDDDREVVSRSNTAQSVYNQSTTRGTDVSSSSPPGTSRATAEGDGKEQQSVQHFEDEVDFLTVVAYQEVSLVAFVSGSIILCIDLHSLEIVHAFHVGYHRTVTAITDMAQCGALLVVDDRCMLTVFGVRPSHVGNQILAVRDLSRAHPSKQWLRLVKESSCKKKKDSSSVVDEQQQQKDDDDHQKRDGATHHQQQKNLTFRCATPTSAAFHPHTCSLIVGDADGGISSWSLRGLKRSLVLRPMHYPFTGAITTRIRAKQLRQLEKVKVPRDVNQFGSLSIEFEFRRGAGMKMALKQQRQQQQQHDEMNDDSLKLPFLTIPSLNVDRSNLESQQQTTTSILPAVAPSLHTLHSSLKLPHSSSSKSFRRDGSPFAEIFDDDDDSGESSSDEDDNNDNDDTEDDDETSVPMKNRKKTTSVFIRNPQQTTLTKEQIQRIEEEKRRAVINPLAAASSTTTTTLHSQIINELLSASQRASGLGDFSNEEISVDLGVREIISLTQIGNRVAFLSVGGSDCRVVLLNRELQSFGELQQSRTREKLGNDELVRTAREQALARKNESESKSIKNNKYKHRKSVVHFLRQEQQHQQQIERDNHHHQQQNKSNKSRCHHDERKIHNNKEDEEELGSIPWRYFDLKEEMSSFLDPRTDLTDAVIARLLCFIHDVRFRVAYSKNMFFSPVTAFPENKNSESKEDDENKKKTAKVSLSITVHDADPLAETKRFEAARKLNLLSLSARRASTIHHHTHHPLEALASDGTHNASKHHQHRTTKTSFILGETRTNNNNNDGYSENRDRLHQFGMDGDDSFGVNDESIITLATTTTSTTEHPIQNNNSTTSLGVLDRTTSGLLRTNSGFLHPHSQQHHQDAFGRQFLEASHRSAQLNDDDQSSQFSVNHYSPVPKHKTALNRSSTRSGTGSDPLLPHSSSSPHIPSLSPPSSNLHDNHHQNSGDHQNKNTTSKPTATSSSSIATSPASSPRQQNHHHHHQTYHSQYHHTASPPTSLQRRRFQLNSNYTVTLPPLELDFKEVMKQAENEWTTGKTQDIQTFSGTSRKSNSFVMKTDDNDDERKKDKKKRGESTKTKEKDDDDDDDEHETKEIFNMLSSSSPEAKSKTKLLQPLSESSLLKMKPSSLSARGAPNLNKNLTTNKRTEISARRDHTMKHRVGVGVSPSLGLSGDEIVRIRETVKSSKDLLASVPKMRLAPLPSDSKLPDSARPLNLPPMKMKL